jgi:hypothetical protein
MALLKKSPNKNVLTILLTLLKVKYTSAFANKYFNEHPHKYNLLGLSQMLLTYGINNGGAYIKDKDNDIFNIQTPFVAHAGGEFMVVNEVSSDAVSYYWNGLNIHQQIKQFTEGWTGFVLLVDRNENSIEPDYNKNRKIEFISSLQRFILLLALCGLFILFFAKHSVYTNLWMTMAMLINLIGVYIGCLLVIKQINIHSDYADKICSLFKQGNCNDVLESKASKFIGLIGWSEIGLGYFISNIIILLFSSELISYLSIINILVLPYSFWSIWYQKRKAKQWCPLCLIVMCLLWLLFFSNLNSGFLILPHAKIIDLVYVAGIYLIPTLVINRLLPKLSEANKIEQITQEINSLKANEDIIITLLKQQPFFESDKSTSKIIFGNPDANIVVTILTNPHCNPCAKMHSRVEKLLEKTNNLCIRYVFSSFEESLDISNKFLIAAYMSNTTEKAKAIFSEWFEKEKYSKEAFFLKYNLPLETPEVMDEFHRHKRWIEKTKITSTPTILVSGIKLPSSYKIEDLLFFKNLDVNSK